MPVEVVAGVADRLPAGDGEFDAAVVSLVLCSVPHLHRALDELRRVLRPGELRFLEHVSATTEGLRRTQQAAIDATIWPMAGAGTSRLS